MPKKKVVLPISLEQLLLLPIGKSRIIVWIRWAYRDSAHSYYLCKEGCGKVFVVPVLGVQEYEEIHHFGQEECHDRIYMEKPNE